MQVNQLPTGFLFTDTYSRGQLETLSIGDYGKEHNIKADFLGYTKEINGVLNKPCMPLSEKWVITLSTQYGCVMNCTFCDVPKIDYRGNATFNDLHHQFLNAIGMFPNQRYTERLNLHFARMGEPIYNKAVFEYSRWLYENKRTFADTNNLRIEVIHPVLTSSCPRDFKFLEARLLEWCEIKNEVYNGQAGLQLSINSTDENQRNVMFNNMQTSLIDLSKIAAKMPKPVGRKYCLNIAYASDNIIDGEYLATLFNPADFMCKVTPIHNNDACKENGIQTIDGYSSYAPYKIPEESLKSAGFDVLVFVPSMDEEDGLVTCGNLVLSGNTPKTGTINIVNV